MVESCPGGSIRDSPYPCASFPSHGRRWPRGSEGLEKTAEDIKESQREEEWHQVLPFWKQQGRISMEGIRKATNI